MTAAFTPISSKGDLTQTEQARPPYVCWSHLKQANSKQLTCWKGLSMTQ